MRAVTNRNLNAIEEDGKMNHAAVKKAALISAVTLVVFEGIATLVQWIDPQGGLLHVDYRNPVQHIIIIAAALGFGIAAYCRACQKERE